MWCHGVAHGVVWIGVATWCGTVVRGELLSPIKRPVCHRVVRVVSRAFAFDARAVHGMYLSGLGLRLCLSVVWCGVVWRGV